MSKVVKFYEFGEPDVLKLEEEPLRQPQAGEVRIQLQALGLNRAEVMYRTNSHPEQAQFPSRIGYEAAGIVDAIGEGVTEFQIGDRVSTIPGFSMNQYGVAGEVAVMPATRVARYPEQFSPEEGTSIWMQYLTAYGALVEFGKLKPGAVVAITAASSSAGIAAIQMVNDAGGTSIAMTRKADKLEKLVREGAHHVIVTDQENMVERVNAIAGGNGADIASSLTFADALDWVNAIAGGNGADIVFDPVSGPYLEKLADIVAPEGLIVEYGWLAEGTPVFPLVPATLKGFRVQGFNVLFQVAAHPERLKAGISYVNQRLHSGAFRPIIAEKRFTLDRIVDAYRYMESNEQFGKIVVVV
ncbi:MAG: zinc-dependent alcohol dehydrogenase family protein [Cyanosarcina radialis HA8281-LM2]|jgi:NADPH:quinone reductase-like Zn-dependent oxidoreductase|nr:zinc-dependent alcohol dehydrogenase family protein [Cyanosarcina radialis HA8281-LM2]